MNEKGGLSIRNKLYSCASLACFIAKSELVFALKQKNALA